MSSDQLTLVGWVIFRGWNVTQLYSGIMSLSQYKDPNFHQSGWLMEGNSWVFFTLLIWVFLLGEVFELESIFVGDNWFQVRVSTMIVWKFEDVCINSGSTLGSVVTSLAVTGQFTNFASRWIVIPSRNLTERNHGYLKLVWFQMSSDQNPGYLLYTRDCSTQLYRDSIKPLNQDPY